MAKNWLCVAEQMQIISLPLEPIFLGKASVTPLPFAPSGMAKEILTPYSGAYYRLVEVLGQ